MTTTAPPGGQDVRVWASKLWDAVGTGDEGAAADCAGAALEAGIPAESVLLDIVGAVQRKVGEEWAANRLTVAQEHAATALSNRVVTALPGLLPAGAGSGTGGATTGRITVACVDGEWHALPARLLCEVLRLRGWEVDWLGARVPTPRLIAHLHRTGPDAVALSGSVPTRLPTAHATITACQAAGIPVLAGGAAFGPGGRWAHRLGADAWAPDAREAAARLAAPLPPPPALTRQSVDDLPHLADQEYTLVVRSAPQLVKETLAGLEERFPSMRDYTERQLQHTAEDIAHIVEFLAAALYVDDDGLFSGFLCWTAGVLTARDVPARSLLPALDLLRDRLDDFPRATRLLAAARAEVAGPRSGPWPATPG